MIGIDTNVLVRYLTNDEPDLAERAERLLERECTPDTPGYVNAVVLSETAWVLRRHYRYSREQIATAIDALLRAPSIAVEHDELAERALKLYRTGNVDFADALIGLINQAVGCRATVTFDRRAAGLETFRPL